MKNFLLPVICLPSIICFFFAISATGQDAFFSNYELTPQLVNPSLTGLIDQDLRVFTTYRNQWSSLVGNDSFRSFLIGAETKVPFDNEITSVGLGFYSLIDRAGSVGFGTNEYNLSASVNRVLSKTEKNSHSLALGFNFGLSEKRVSIEDIMLPNPSEILSNKKYADFSTGVSWAFNSNKGINSELGFSIFHFNKPNISLTQGGASSLSSRYVAHARIEIPFGRLALTPSYLYMDQGPHHQSLFGLAGRFKTNAKSNWIQVGLLARRTKSFTNESQISSYVVNSAFKFNDFLLGLSYDRFTKLNTNSYEFSLNYFFNYRQGNNSTNN